MSRDPRDRQARFALRLEEKRQAELNRELDALAARDDFHPALTYFLDLLRTGFAPETVSRRTGRPVVNLLCLQAPLELFHAYGLQPLKIFSGSQVAGQLAAPKLPALMCPMLKAALGALELAGGAADQPWVIPTTCDWVVKFREMADLCGLPASGPCHWLELPHLKDAPRARERWLEEVLRLRDFLAEVSGRRLRRRALADSVAVFQKTRRAFARLIEARRAGRVPTVWFLIIANSFFMDRVETWTAALERALEAFPNRTTVKGLVYLAGSPIFFPNFKLLHLLEAAGLTVAADDLCSSERLFPAHLAVDDPSEFGLLRALAETYHQGCLCPTFGDNERRINAIHGAVRTAAVKGVVFQVLKGCHPYDLESFTLEEPLKKAGLKFLKLETDYTAEDARNLLTRLEAFSHNLENI